MDSQHGLGAPLRFVDAFRAILFDMNGTFMFGHDRLNASEDFHATYQALGGSRLTAEAVHASVLACCAGFSHDYADAMLVDAFPSLETSVCRHGGLQARQDVQEIAAVIAHHEVGHVPPWASDTVIRLSRTHAVGVVSNVWAPSSCWRAELARSGVAAVFRCSVFSSDFGSIKPSPRLFLESLHALDLEPGDVLFVGDSLERDIQPAKALGMGTAWVAPAGEHASADVRVASIVDLLTLI